MNVDNNDNGSIERPNMYFDPDLVKYLVYIRVVLVDPNDNLLQLTYVPTFVSIIETFEEVLYLQVQPTYRHYKEWMDFVEFEKNCNGSRDKRRIVSLGYGIGTLFNAGYINYSFFAKTNQKHFDKMKKLLRSESEITNDDNEYKHYLLVSRKIVYFFSFFFIFLLCYFIYKNNFTLLFSKFFSAMLLIFILFLYYYNVNNF